MKCCGSERTTPYCSSCGKQLMKPSPLVEILQQERKKLVESEMLLEKAKNEKWNRASTEQIEATLNKAKSRIEALEEAMTNLSNPAKVMSDWLKDNGYEEAARALLGAFSGVPS